jgi:hypothetical protein
VFVRFDNSTPPLRIPTESVALTNANTRRVTFASSQSGSWVVNANRGGAMPTFSIRFGVTLLRSDLSGRVRPVDVYPDGVESGRCGGAGGGRPARGGPYRHYDLTCANTVDVRLCNFSGAPRLLRRGIKTSVVH